MVYESPWVDRTCFAEPLPQGRLFRLCGCPLQASVPVFYGQGVPAHKDPTGSRLANPASCHALSTPVLRSSLPKVKDPNSAFLRAENPSPGPRPPRPHPCAAQLPETDKTPGESLRRWRARRVTVHSPHCSSSRVTTLSTTYLGPSWSFTTTTIHLSRMARATPLATLRTREIHRGNTFEAVDQTRAHGFTGYVQGTACRAAQEGHAGRTRRKDTHESRAAGPAGRPRRKPGGARIRHHTEVAKQRSTEVSRYRRGKREVGEEEVGKEGRREGGKATPCLGLLPSQRRGWWTRSLIIPHGSK